MKMILMGTGTSHGVPVIACDCKVCTSSDSRDKRLRCSAFIHDENTNIVIDTGPEFRIQALKFKIKKLDAVLLTHSHADHLHGLDDLRVFSHTISADSKKETAGNGLLLYANPQTLKDITFRFDYIFKEVQIGGGKPKLNFTDNSIFTPQNPIKINDLQILPVPLKHGRLDDSGYLITNTKTEKSIAYLTDCSFISDESIQLIKDNARNLECVVIDALRKEPHQTHFGFSQALEVAEKLQPRQTYFTHMTHNFSHVEIQQFIKENLDKYPALEKIVKNGGKVEPGFDGLEIEF